MPSTPANRTPATPGRLRGSALRREERRRDVALAGVGQHARRCACRATPGARRPASRPTAPRRTRCPASTPSRDAASAGGLDRVLVGHRDDLVEHLAVEHRRHEARRRCPGSGAGRARAPESTGAATAARRATTSAFGLRSLSASPAPVIVPPVPTPATRTSTWPSSAARISGPVPVRCASGLAGLENWSGRKCVGLARPARARRRPPRSCRPATRRSRPARRTGAAAPRARGSCPAAGRSRRS